MGGEGVKQPTVCGTKMQSDSKQKVCCLNKEFTQLVLEELSFFFFSPQDLPSYITPNPSVRTDNPLPNAGRLGQNVHGAHKDSSGHGGRQERFCLPVRGESQPGETSGLQCTHEHMLGSVESSGIFPRVPHAAANVGVICPCCSTKLACNSFYSQSRKKMVCLGQTEVDT